MKKDEVKIDGTYLAKVSGGVVPVRITGEKWSGDKHVGWVGVNTKTNRSVRIKSAQRLRAEVQHEGGGEAGAGQEPDAGATTAQAGEVAAAPASDATAKGGATGGTKGGKGGTKGRGSLRAQAAADQENARMRDEREASPDGMTASERAMANSATTKPGKAAKAPKEPKPAKPKKTSALDAAALVLAEAGAPMKAKEMVAQMEAKGLWSSPGGKTPEATLYAAIIREIAAKGKDARFRKTERGTFVATEHAQAATAGKEG